LFISFSIGGLFKKLLKMPLEESGFLTVFTYCAVIQKGDRRSNYPTFFLIIHSQKKNISVAVTVWHAKSDFHHNYKGIRGLTNRDYVLRQPLKQDKSFLRNIASPVFDRAGLFIYSK